jgi:hypothetical protein
METTRPKDFDPQAIVDALNGTANDIQEALDDYYPGMLDTDMLSTDHDIIDNQIFKCSCCGWWCEIHEAVENDGGSEDICTDCKDEGDDGTDEEE